MEFLFLVSLMILGAWALISADKGNSQNIAGEVVVEGGVYDHVEYRETGGIFNRSYTVAHFANGEVVTFDGRLNFPYPKGTKIKIVRKQGWVTTFFMVEATK